MDRENASDMYPSSWYILLSVMILSFICIGFVLGFTYAEIIDQSEVLEQIPEIKMNVKSIIDHLSKLATPDGLAQLCEIGKVTSSIHHTSLKAYYIALVHDKCHGDSNAQRYVLASVLAHMHIIMTSVPQLDSWYRAFDIMTTDADTAQDYRLLMNLYPNVSIDTPRSLLEYFGLTIEGDYIKMNI